MTKPKPKMNLDVQAVKRSLEEKRSQKRQIEFQLRDVNRDISALESRLIAMTGGL